MVQAFQASEEEGKLYIVTEYVHGTNLARIVKARGRLPTADACEVVRQAALGLQYIHDNALVHRDVKPSNLMLTAGGQVKVLDLGLARLGEEPSNDDRPTSVGQILGTFDYMAPEQAQDPRGVDRTADVYSLGCTFYHLLTGQVPFPATSRAEKLAAHRTLQPPLLVRFGKEFPPGLQAVLSRMLAKKPSERHQAAIVVAKELEPFTRRANLRDLHGPSQPSTLCEVHFVHVDHRKRYLLIGWLIAAVLFLAATSSLVLLLGRTGEAFPAEPVRLDGHRQQPTQLAFASDGKLAFSADPSGAFSWDVPNLTMRTGWKSGEPGMVSIGLGQLDPGGPALVGLTDQVKYRVESHDPSTGVRTGTLLEQTGGCLLLSFSGDGQRTLVVESDGSAHVFSSRGGQLLHERKLESRPRCTYFGPDGRAAGFGCEDGIVRIWTLDDDDLRLYRGLPPGPSSSIIAVGVDLRREEVLAVDQGAAVAAVWNLKTGAVEANVSLQWKSTVLECASIGSERPDVIWTGHDDGTTALWMLSHKGPVTHYRQHSGCVGAVALSPDARWALSAGHGETPLYLYRLPSVSTR